MTRPAATLGRDLRQTAGDVFIRQAMKAVAAHALCIEVLAGCVMICNRAVAAMKGGIEAGNLRQTRRKRQNGADGREIVRLVQGRKRHIALEPGEHLRVYENRTVVLRAAMDDAVADRAWRYPMLFPQPCAGHLQRRRHV